MEIQNFSQVLPFLNPCMNLENEEELFFLPAIITN